MQSKPTLVLVADGNQARMFSQTPTQAGVLWTMASRDAATQTRELVSDKPGQSFSSVGYSRHAMTPQVSAQRAAQLKFARRVADAVERTTAETDFDKLIMVAPPRTLGDLRNEISPRVRAAVTEEINKDLANLADHDVLAHLAETRKTARS